MGRPVKNLKGKKFGRLTVLIENGRDKCGGAKWECLCDCGNIVTVRSNDLQRVQGTKSCGCLQAEIQSPGALNANWKGGRSKHKTNGYIFLSGHKGHPRANVNGQVAEHVIVMERIIGRYLLTGETVHHKNGHRDDNSESNLELWASSHPPGQRIEDLISHAVGILQQYSPEKLRS